MTNNLINGLSSKPQEIEEIGYEFQLVLNLIINGLSSKQLVFVEIVNDIKMSVVLNLIINGLSSKLEDITSKSVYSTRF